MAKVKHTTSSRVNDIVGSGGTSFELVGESEINSVGTEALKQITFRTAGICSRLFIQVSYNDIPDSSSAALRINGADGNLIATIPASMTGEFEDITNTDTISAGDELNYRITGGAGGTELEYTVLSILFAATSGTVKRFAVYSPNGQSGSNANRVFPFEGGITGVEITTNEAKNQQTVRTLGTIRNLFVYVSSNTRNANTTFRLRKNTANSNQVVTVSSTSTGIFEDTTNTDNVVSGDTIGYLVNFATGSGTIVFDIVSEEFYTPDNTFHFINASNHNGAFNPNPASTYYFAIGGSIANPASTTSEAQAPANQPMVSSSLMVYIPLNSYTTFSHMYLVINGVAGNKDVVIINALTGSFEDTTVDVIKPTDDIYYQYDTGVGGTQTLNSISMLVSASPYITGIQNITGIQTITF